MTDEVQHMVFNPSGAGPGDWLNSYRGQVGKVLLFPDGTSRMYHLEFPDGKRIAAWGYELEPIDV